MHISMILKTEMIAFAILMGSKNVLKNYTLEFPVSLQ